MLYQRVSVPSTDGFSLPLDVYCPEVYPEIDPDIQRPAVVICPGGAYRYLSPREAEPVALVFAAMGFNAFVAGYRVAPHCYPRPQQDAAAAVAWVRAHAGETHTHPDKIAIMGFSAGGHCAASLGVWWPRADLWAELGLTPEPAAKRPIAVPLKTSPALTTSMCTCAIPWRPRSPPKRPLPSSGTPGRTPPCPWKTAYFSPWRSSATGCRRRCTCSPLASMAPPCAIPKPPVPAART